jgi:DNA polymerase alpha subunit A
VYVSCCVTVHNNMRNMFVLPKYQQATGERSNMMDVHGEMKKIIEKVMPKQSGASWAGKPVKRKYAFEVEGVPREETQYLKVKYPATFPTIPHQVCQEGGQHVERIFGGNVPTLETFIIKRGLMGPCWIDIKGFTASTANVSHCKIEVNVQNPKNIKRGPDMPAPPVVTMTLKMKTVVNPKSHKSEIVSLCAVCNRDGDIEGGGVSSASSMQQLSLVRPLGLAAADGIMATFPHDLDNEIRSVMPQLKKNPNERAMISRFMAQVGAWDPDVIVGHNAWGFDVEVLLSRCKELKVNSWDRLGRLKRAAFPGQGRFENGVKDWVIAECMSGRVLCDTYISSKELLREVRGAEDRQPRK